MTDLIVFDDTAFHAPTDPVAPDLAPLTDLMATFDIRTGASTTLERLERAAPGKTVALWTPAHLEAVTALAHDRPVNILPDGERFLCLNGRFAYPPVSFDLAPGQALVESDSSHVIAAHLDRASIMSFLETGTLPDVVQAVTHDGQLLIRRPWEVIAWLPDIMTLDLLDTSFEDSAPIPPGVTHLGEAPIYVDPTAEIGPGVILDASQGPIVIASRATLRPACTIIGPAYVGEDSHVLDRALLKPNTVIGPVCKVAGEVGATIFQGYSNKAHDGHLGHSFVGRWVNIGAGTVNSNLLNTYGPIHVAQRPGTEPQNTAMMYLGAFLGDHVKTAIGTRLMTGSIIGTGAMIACSAAPPTCVAPFAWLTDAGASVYRIDRFVEVARNVMARRNVQLNGAMEWRLRALHQQTTTA